VQGAAPFPDADQNTQREVVDAFLAASREGDFAALIAVSTRMSCCAPMAAACSRAYRGWFAGVVFEWRERPFSVSASRSGAVESSKSTSLPTPTGCVGSRSMSSTIDAFISLAPR
jgi:hypothetical protein